MENLKELERLLKKSGAEVKVIEGADDLLKMIQGRQVQATSDLDKLCAEYRFEIVTNREGDALNFTGNKLPPDLYVAAHEGDEIIVCEKAAKMESRFSKLFEHWMSHGQKVFNVINAVQPRGKDEEAKPRRRRVRKAA